MTEYYVGDMRRLGSPLFSSKQNPGVFLMGVLFVIVSVYG